MEPIFEEVKRIIESNNNCNFHFDALDWTTRVWILKLCDVMDERLEEIEQRIKE